MEKEIKFYTPDLSEFHVGFECEWRLKELGSYTETSAWALDWHKHTIDINDFSDHDLADEFHNITKDYINEFRVKYLDAEDLKELGFQITMEEEKPYGYYFAGKKKYTAREKNKSVGIPADIRTVEVRCSHVKTDYSHIYLKLTDSHFKGHMEFNVRSKNDLRQILRLTGTE